MNFSQAEERFKELKARFAAGDLTETEFKAKLEELMVEDEDGNWWMLGYETERWYRYDGTNWVQADPPGGSAPEVEPAKAPATPAAKPAQAAPTTPARRRWPILLVGLGAIALVVCAGLGFFLARSALLSSPATEPPVPTAPPATEAPISINPPEPTATPEPTEQPSTPTIPADVSAAPVLDTIILRYDTSSGELRIFQDISFHDPDGDAISVHYELVSATAYGVTLEDGPIGVAPQQQITGAMVTGTFNCGGVRFEARVRASILDRAGHESNAQEYTMYCS